MSGCKEGVQSLVARMESSQLLPGESPVIDCPEVVQFMLLEEILVLGCKEGVQWLVSGSKSNYFFPRESPIIKLQQGVQSLVAKYESNQGLPGGSPVIINGIFVTK